MKTPLATGFMALAATLAFVSPRRLLGQSTTLVAAVAENGTGAPIVGAEVIIIDLHRTARTNWIGEAMIGAVPAGRHRVRVRKLGYAAADIELEFRGDTVGPVFMLTAQPPSLDTVRVTAEHASLRLQAFENRKRMGIGRFVTDSVLERDPDRSFAEVAATHFPGLILQTDHFGVPYIMSMRPQCSAMGCGRCAPRVMLDDTPLSRDAFDLIRTWDLAGMEYYSGNTMPVQYRIAGSDCGLLLLWSK